MKKEKRHAISRHQVDRKLRSRRRVWNVLWCVGIENCVEATLEAVLERLEGYIGGLRIDHGVEEQRNTLIRSESQRWPEPEKACGNGSLTDHEECRDDHTPLHANYTNGRDPSAERHTRQTADCHDDLQFDGE